MRSLFSRAPSDDTARAASSARDAANVSRHAPVTSSAESCAPSCHASSATSCATSSVPTSATASTASSATEPRSDPGCDPPSALYSSCQTTIPPSPFVRLRTSVPATECVDSDAAAKCVSGGIPTLGQICVLWPLLIERSCNFVREHDSIECNVSRAQA